MIDHYQVVLKLIGPIMPIGESNADAERLINLKNMTHLVDRLLSDIDVVAFYKDHHAASVKSAGKHASEFFDQIGIQE